MNGKLEAQHDPLMKDLSMETAKTLHSDRVHDCAMYLRLVELIEWGRTNNLQSECGRMQRSDLYTPAECHHDDEYWKECCHGDYEYVGVGTTAKVATDAVVDGDRSRRI
jgi:hypothetical protein